MAHPAVVYGLQGPCPSIFCPVSQKNRIFAALNGQEIPGRDAGVVDRGGLENRCPACGTQGSNPCLSARGDKWVIRSFVLFLFPLECLNLLQLKKI